MVKLTNESEKDADRQIDKQTNREQAQKRQIGRQTNEELEKSGMTRNHL